MTDQIPPSPPPTTHPDDRELGYGAVDARPDDAAGLGDSEAAPGKINTSQGGGESSGGAYVSGPTPHNPDGDHAGQSHQGYSGGDNPNSVSTKNATRDRAG